MLQARVSSIPVPVVNTPSESHPTPTLVLELYSWTLTLVAALATKPVAPSPYARLSPMASPPGRLILAPVDAAQPYLSAGCPWRVVIGAAGVVQRDAHSG